MRSLTFRTKILLLTVGSSLLLTLATTLFSLYELSSERERMSLELRKTLLADYDRNVKTLVETALSTVKGIHQQTVAEGGTIDDAKRRAAAAVRGMRYGSDGYFFVDTSAGDNVVMLGKPDVEGKNRIDLKDATGKALIREIIDAAKKGGGYTDYFFPSRGRALPSPSGAIRPGMSRSTG